MVSWVPQIIYPPLVALAFLPALPRKWVILLAPVTYLADLDYLVPGEHRVWTHTLLIPFLLLGIVWLLRRKRKLGEQSFWAFATTPGWPLVLTLTSYFLTAHAIMDVFTGGVALFWPILPTNFLVDLSIDINLQTGEVLPHGEAQANPEPAPLDPAYPWFTNEHAAILAFLFVVGLTAAGVFWGRRLRRKRIRAEQNG